MLDPDMTRGHKPASHVSQDGGIFGMLVNNFSNVAMRSRGSGHNHLGVPCVNIADSRLKAAGRKTIVWIFRRSTTLLYALYLDSVAVHSLSGHMTSCQFFPS